MKTGSKKTLKKLRKLLNFKEDRRVVSETKLSKILVLDVMKQ